MKVLPFEILEGIVTNCNDPSVLLNLSLSCSSLRTTAIAQFIKNIIKDIVEFNENFIYKRDDDTDIKNIAKLYNLSEFADSKQPRALCNLILWKARHFLSHCTEEFRVSCINIIDVLIENDSYFSHVFRTTKFDDDDKLSDYTENMQQNFRTWDASYVLCVALHFPMEMIHRHFTDWYNIGYSWIEKSLTPAPNVKMYPEGNLNNIAKLGYWGILLDHSKYGHRGDDEFGELGFKMTESLMIQEIRGCYKRIAGVDIGFVNPRAHSMYNYRRRRYRRIKIDPIRVEQAQVFVDYLCLSLPEKALKLKYFCKCDEPNCDCGRFRMNDEVKNDPKVAEILKARTEYIGGKLWFFV